MTTDKHQKCGRCKEHKGEFKNLTYDKKYGRTLCRACRNYLIDEEDEGKCHLSEAYGLF